MLTMTHVHFIGIGGTGLSAIARLLKESGYEVSGSDRLFSPFAEDLQKQGITVHFGHQPQYIHGADWVVRSSAVTDENPEVKAALQAGIPVYKRADFLGRLMTGRNGIAVAGTHGKTTTTAMIAWMLHALKRDPSFIVGGVVNNLMVNARAGKGETFVIEADEYDGMFLGLKPRIEVVTNLEHDHPDCYPTYADMVLAFEKFVDLLPPDGALIACGDDAGALALSAHAGSQAWKVILYGLHDQPLGGSPHWMKARDLTRNDRGGFDFSVMTNLEGTEGGRVRGSLQVPGEHNVRNALACLCVAALLGLPLQEAAETLSEFIGAGRRFEVRGEANGILAIDDYAHHPTEIRATLSAARSRYPHRRIWAVWQPHTYSRTRTLFKEFLLAFPDADRVLVTEIYASREARQDFSSAEVVNSMSHPSARYSGSLQETSDILMRELRPGDVFIVLSAGDADQISANVLKGLQEGS